jgi:nicotinamide-nucleotide amidase
MVYDKQALDALALALIETKESIAVAESVTAGHLQAALSGATKAMQFFQGGITTYNIGQKTRLLSVDPVHALEVNSVSLKVSEQMALGVSRLFIADWGVGITGFASKAPAIGEMSLYAEYVVVKNGIMVHSGRIDAVKEENSFNVQVYFTNQVLQMLVTLLQGKI